MSANEDTAISISDSIPGIFSASPSPSFDGGSAPPREAKALLSHLFPWGEVLDKLLLESVAGAESLMVCVRVAARNEDECWGTEPGCDAEDDAVLCSRVSAKPAKNLEVLPMVYVSSCLARGSLLVPPSASGVCMRAASGERVS